MTRIAVHLDDAGRVRTDLRGGALAPRVLERGPAHVRIALVATVALLLAGDEVAVHVDVGRGVHLELVETAGTVAHDMRGGSASWHVSAVVGDAATLVWDGLPLVVSAGARVSRRTSVVLGAGARAMLREGVVLGRSGERGGDLLLSTDVRRADGWPVLREDLDLTGPARDQAGVLGGGRCMDQLTLLGLRADLDGPAVLQLAEPGTLVRSLDQDWHRAELTALSTYFHQEVLTRKTAEPPVKQAAATILPFGCNARGNEADVALATG